MPITRREFFHNGIAAFTVSIVVPTFLSDLARVQAASTRNLVVLNLTGGNDGLSTLVPYTDPFYYSRRPTLAIPAGSVLQIGSDSGGHALGLHPALTGLRDIFSDGRVAVIQRAGYANSSRSHFQGTDIWSTANPANSQGAGWVGPISRHVATAGGSAARLEHAERHAAHAGVADGVGRVDSARRRVRVQLAEQRRGGRVRAGGREAHRVASADRSADRRLRGDDGAGGDGHAEPGRIRRRLQTQRRRIPNNGFGQALQAVAGAMAKDIGTKVFFVQTGGFDTHASQDVNSANGAYVKLMKTLNDGLTAFYTDLRNIGLINDTVLLTFSEFGRRITENGSKGTDHGSASVMLAMGGAVRGGLYGTAASLNPDPQNPTLENSGGDVHFETDFRSVYARVIDNWLGGDSVGVLGGNFRRDNLNFV